MVSLILIDTYYSSRGFQLTFVQPLRSSSVVNSWFIESYPKMIANPDFSSEAPKRQKYDMTISPQNKTRLIITELVSVEAEISITYALNTVSRIMMQRILTK